LHSDGHIMYQLTKEDVDQYWLAQEGGMGWMRKWLGWWCCPNHSGDAQIIWCREFSGKQDFDWAYYDGRFYFKQQKDATMFLLKFGDR